jgi:hypothetical protein
VRAPLAWLCFAAACRPDPSADYLQRELTFFQGYVDAVDPQREALEVRRVLAQRRLRVEDELSEVGYVALGARQPGGPLSAVRLVTRRGVVLGVDGDLSAPLAPSEVSLASSAPRQLEDLDLVTISLRARALDLGCLRLFRVLGDGRVVELKLDVSALGSRACVAELRAAGGGRLLATVGFPGLAQLRVPRLPVELELDPVPLGRPDPLVRRLVLGLERGWITRAEAALSPDALAREPDFSGRHAIGVARAALAAVGGRGLTAQRAAYLEALRNVAQGSAEAALVADTVAHIERGWLDMVAGPAPDPDVPGAPLEDAVADAGVRADVEAVPAPVAD